MVIDMWAQIKDGIVSEITDIDPDGRFHPSIKWIYCTDSVKPGFLYDGAGFREPDIEISQAPALVTMRQARLALHAEGLLQSVEDAIGSMPEPSQTAARIEWDHAGHVERSSQFVAMLGAAIGLSDAQMDAMFMAASIL